MSCPDCERKDRTILLLEDMAAQYKEYLYTEKKRTCALSEALQEIRLLAQNKMFYPCSFEAHQAVDAEQKKYTGEDVFVTPGIIGTTTS